MRARLSQPGESFCNHRVAVLGGMLITKRGGGSGMPGARHERSGRGALRGGPREPCATQVVEVDSGRPNCRGLLAGRVQRVPTEPAPMGTRQERRGRLGADEGPQLPLQARHHGGADAHGPTTSVGLGWTEVACRPPTSYAVRSTWILRWRRSASRRSRPRTSPTPPAGVLPTRLSRSRGVTTQPSRVRSAGVRPLLTGAPTGSRRPAPELRIDHVIALLAHPDPGHRT